MSRRTQRRSTRRHGFTLTELLIVMGIIVLVALVAVPSFRALTGGRSTEAAQNQLASFLQRARQEAIGVQELRGVAFILSSETQRPTAVMVRAVTSPVPRPAGQGNVDVYLDAVADRDTLELPAGVGIQTIDDCVITPPAAAATPDPSDDVRADDAYIGMGLTTQNGATFRYGGVILFDEFGRLVNKQYAFMLIINGQPSNIAQLWQATGAGAVAFKPGVANDLQPRSAFGFVLYDQDAFDNLGFKAADNKGDDPQFDSSLPAYADVNETTWQSSQTGRSDEAREERWLDANAAPILVNRNNGTLVRGQ